LLLLLSINSDRFGHADGDLILAAIGSPDHSIQLGFFKKEADFPHAASFILAKHQMQCDEQSVKKLLARRAFQKPRQFWLEIQAFTSANPALQRGARHIVLACELPLRHVALATIPLIQQLSRPKAGPKGGWVVLSVLCRRMGSDHGSSFAKGLSIPISLG